MRWYGGSIAEAVSLSKSRDAIFVVYIEGENELSNDMIKTLEEEPISTRLGSVDNFLLIKVNSDSPTYTQFAQIYQFVPVPSLFFIGRDGIPLEVIGAGINAPDLAARIDKLVLEHTKSQGSPSTSTSSLRSSSQTFLDRESSAAQVQSAPTSSKAESRSISTDHSPGLPRLESAADVGSLQKSDATPSAASVPDGSEQAYDIVCEDDVCTRVLKERNSLVEDNAAVSTTLSASLSSIETTQEAKLQSTKSSQSVDDKVERAKALIEQKRLEKLKEEKELERQRELERRAQGQGVAELKRWQQDQEMKVLQEERKRERLENTKERARILEQIAQDRAEHKSRETAVVPGAPVTIQTTTSVPSSETAAPTNARIQFKLPDGSSRTAQFDPDSDLSELRAYVMQNIQTGFTNVAIWTSYPRRELSVAEDSVSLRNLGLAPSAALLVLGTGGSASGAPPRSAPGSSSALSTDKIRASVTALYQLLSTLFHSYIWTPMQSTWSYLRDMAAGTSSGSTSGSSGSSGVINRGTVNRAAGQSTPTSAPAPADAPQGEKGDGGY